MLPIEVLFFYHILKDVNLHKDPQSNYNNSELHFFARPSGNCISFLRTFPQNDEYIIWNGLYFEYFSLLHKCIKIHKTTRRITNQKYKAYTVPNMLAVNNYGSQCRVFTKSISENIKGTFFRIGRKAKRSASVRFPRDSCQARTPRGSYRICKLFQPVASGRTASPENLIETQPPCVSRGLGFLSSCSFCPTCSRDKP